MAQRAVDMTARYLSCLSARCGADFFRIGNASRHRPFAARLMPRSAEDEASATGVFAVTCAAEDVAKSPQMQKTIVERQLQESFAIESRTMRNVERPVDAPRSISCDLQPNGGDAGSDRNGVRNLRIRKSPA